MGYKYYQMEITKKNSLDVEKQIFHSHFFLFLMYFYLLLFYEDHTGKESKATSFSDNNL